MTIAMTNVEVENIEKSVAEYRAKFDHYITDELVRDVHNWLGEEGREFFQQCLDYHGNICPVFMRDGFPHNVHRDEGMKVRNYLRTNEISKDWYDDHMYDNMYGVILERALHINSKQLKLRVEL